MSPVGQPQHWLWRVAVEGVGHAFVGLQFVESFVERVSQDVTLVGAKREQLVQQTVDLERVGVPADLEVAQPQLVGCQYSGWHDRSLASRQ